MFLDLAFDPDLVEEEREEEEIAAEEELADGAFTKGISEGTESAMGMKAKAFDEDEGSDLQRHAFPSVLMLGIPIGNKVCSAKNLFPL